MSLQMSPMALIPAETARVARAAFSKGTLCLQVHDTLGPLYEDAQFAALFSPTGQPAEAPARLALVLILQFAEGLSDRQAAEAVRGRIDWKYALTLALTNAGSLNLSPIWTHPGLQGQCRGQLAGSRLHAYIRIWTPLGLQAEN